MTVLVNGDKHELADRVTIVSLLDRLGLSKAACAVEVNKELIPKRHHTERTLADGDHVEIVTLVGGG
jgi:sulfur carrier protein